MKNLDPKAIEIINKLIEKTNLNAVVWELGKYKKGFTTHFHNGKLNIEADGIVFYLSIFNRDDICICDFDIMDNINDENSILLSKLLISARYSHYRLDEILDSMIEGLENNIRNDSEDHTQTLTEIYKNDVSRHKIEINKLNKLLLKKEDELRSRDRDLIIANNNIERNLRDFRELLGKKDELIEKSTSKSNSFWSQTFKINKIK